MITTKKLLELSPDQVLDQFGSRVGNLVFAKRFENIGYRVPDFACVPIEVSASINARISLLHESLLDSEHYFRAPKILEDEIWRHTPEYTKNHVKRLFGFSDKPLIIRGTSRLEGIEPLSFAGVCYSHLPKNRTQQDTNDLVDGLKGVLAGSRSKYGYYYKNAHNLTSQIFDVGVIGMDMIANPIYYGTSYTYDDHIGIRLLGSNTNIDQFYDKSFLKKESNAEEKLINWISETCSQLKSQYCDSTGLDIEFLITKESDILVLWIVQVRPITSIHLKNYRKSNPSCTQKSHLINTVGAFSGKVTQFTYQENTLLEIKDDSVLYIVSHNGGKGTFEFLSSLPDTPKGKIGCIVIHSSNGHDHLQYSIFEDPRLSFIYHARNETINLPEGTQVSLRSDGFSLTY